MCYVHVAQIRNIQCGAGATHDLLQIDSIKSSGLSTRDTPNMEFVLEKYLEGLFACLAFGTSFKNVSCWTECPNSVTSGLIN